MDTMWYYRLTADKEFVQMTRAQHKDFFWGRVASQPTVPGAVLIAVVFLALEHRRAVRVEHVRFERYPVSEHGDRSRAILDQAKQFYARLCTLDSQPEPRSYAAVAERRWIGQQLLWQPSDEDRRALALVVNRRARRDVFRPGGRPVFLIK